MAIGREWLKRDEVAYVATSIGQFNIDLRAEVFVQNGHELIDIIEAMKAMDGVKDMVSGDVMSFGFPPSECGLDRQGRLGYDAMLTAPQSRYAFTRPEAPNQGSNHQRYPGF